MADGNCIRFCKGCEFANGVEEAPLEETVRVAPTSDDFDLRFLDETGNATNLVRVEVVGDRDSYTYDTASREVRQRASGCDEPTLETRKRAGGLLGSRAVRGCGAFPGQNPKRPRISVAEGGGIIL